MTGLFLRSSAILSPCGLYRYSLSRVWDERLPLVCWVMLNPSTADADRDDPTIRRCVGFARDWGAGGIVVTNLFAFRATDPRELFRAKGPVGPDNDRHIAESSGGRRTLAAWGAHGGYLGRDLEVLRLLGALGCRVECLGLTKKGLPRHPLYVSGQAQPAPLPPAKGD